jgi:hypothetical protein
LVVVSTSTTLGTRISRGKTSHIPSGRQENISRPLPVGCQPDKNQERENFPAQGRLAIVLVRFAAAPLSRLLELGGGLLPHEAQAWIQTDVCREYPMVGFKRREAFKVLA